MKKFFKKRWVRTTLIIIAAVVACGFASRLTSNFTNFDPEEMFSLKLNEDNYFFEKIDDGDFYSSGNIDAVAKDGIITFDGEIADSDPATVKVGETVELPTLQLKAGEYTFTCFNDEKPSWKGYYAVGTFVSGGETYTWYADFEDAPNNKNDSKLLLGKTITLKEDTAVFFEIRFCEGVELDNLKAVPVLVDGDEDGAYSNGIFG